jgi:hypothetical protein
MLGRGSALLARRRGFEIRDVPNDELIGMADTTIEFGLGDIVDQHEHTGVAVMQSGSFAVRWRFSWTGRWSGEV